MPVTDENFQSTLPVRSLRHSHKLRHRARWVSQGSANNWLPIAFATLFSDTELDLVDLVTTASTQYGLLVTSQQLIN